jgi:hypothetical protein
MGKERSQCLLCMNILATGSMKPNRLRRDLKTVHAECVGKTLNFSVEN